jgi:Na+/H+ antiporter NhaD/arsenite permease-like protein
MPHFPVALLPQTRILAGTIIFLASYLVFALGKFPGLKIDRTGAAIVGATAMLVFQVAQPRDAVKAVDFGTIVLLFSMMLVVGGLKLAGFFEWSAEFILRRLQGRLLLPAIILAGGVLSAFLVNDIVCLVMVPFVLIVTRKLRLPPLPFLLAVATSSNIGSLATITGNPQNMLIGSYSGIAYRDFLFHLGPVSMMGLVLDWLILRWLFSRELNHVNLKKIAIPPSVVDTSRLLKPGLVVSGVVVAFLCGIPPVLAASIGAAVLLISRSDDPRKLYGEIDWGLLAFFVGLFIIVNGAEQVGLVNRLLQIAQRWNLTHAASFTVVTALFSNFVSNVPAVMLLKSLVKTFADPRKGWLMLAMASTLAGNLTITGSVANIIVVETAKPDVHIGFWDYFRVGLPITVATIFIGALWLAYAV